MRPRNLASSLPLPRFPHQAGDHTLALGDLDLFALQQKAFDLFEFVAQIPNRGFRPCDTL